MYTLAFCSVFTTTWNKNIILPAARQTIYAYESIWYVAVAVFHDYNIITFTNKSGLSNGRNDIVVITSGSISRHTRSIPPRRVLTVFPRCSSSRRKRKPKKKNVLMSYKTILPASTLTSRRAETAKRYII